MVRRGVGTPNTDDTDDADDTDDEGAGVGERHETQSDEGHEFEHGRAEERAEEAAKPSDVGALDGAAAAGSAAAVGSESGDEDEGAIPTSEPDPTVGPD